MLPSRFGELTGLTQLELRGNRLEGLPVELSECRLLKRSGLIVEEDLFNTLPPEVKEQLWRADKEQAWVRRMKEKKLLMWSFCFPFILLMIFNSFYLGEKAFVSRPYEGKLWTGCHLSLETHIHWSIHVHTFCKVKSFMCCPLQARRGMHIDDSNSNMVNMWVRVPVKAVAFWECIDIKSNMWFVHYLLSGCIQSGKGRLFMNVPAELSNM